MEEQEALRRKLSCVQKGRAMNHREWKDYLIAGNLEKVRQFIDDGFDVNSDIGIVRSHCVGLTSRIATSLSFTV